MTPSQIRRLQYLTDNIIYCRKCDRLRLNGIAIPYWNPKSKYVILAEGPGRNEVEDMTPLVGDAGKLTFREIRKIIGLKREDFFLINSVQCRPLTPEGRNGKPTFGEIENCSFWINKYLETIKPKYLLAFGNYAMDFLFRENTGIVSKCGTHRLYDLCGNKINVFPCIHPANVIYNPENIELFRKSLRRFRKEI